MRKFLLLIFWVSVSSCTVGKRQKQVWLGALQRTHAAESKNIVRAYFDKWGNLYPEIDQHIPYKSFFDPYTGTNTTSHGIGAGNLEKYYCIQTGKLKDLAVSYNLTGTGLAGSRDSFYAVQQIMIERQVKKIQHLFDQVKTTTLIVFIHGFNDPDPTGDYQQLREAIRGKKYDSDNPVYLELFWDGLTANQGNPGLAGIWGRAQQNSAYVSLTLRDILRRLPESTRIRIITHSLGASVATGALFNTVSKWQKKYVQMNKLEKPDRKWDYFDSVRKIPAPKQKDIRIGMLAPAIPGEATFVDFENRNWSGIFQNNISRIVVGYNVNDLAVSKRVGKSDFLAPRMGATSLGCNLMVKGKSETERVSDLLSKKYPGVFVPIDFSEYTYREKKEEHGLYYYLLRRQSSSFLKSLFE